MLRLATALQLEALQAVKGDPKISLEAFRTSSTSGFIAYTSVQLLALYSAPFQLSVFRFIAHLTVLPPLPLLYSTL